jgi:lysophospholipid acyltransferase (LPLAT)-like uncharacterized protein
LPGPNPHSLRDRLVFWAGSLAGALIIKILNRSCRVSVVGASFDPMGAPDRAGCAPIYVAWHQRMFAYFEYLGCRHVAVMISRSRDGEMVSRAAAHLGFRPIRGSSTRGAAGALRELLDVLDRRRPVGFLADGPKGPPRIAKMGPIAAGRHRGDPVVPLAWNADRKWVLKSWDRYYVPKPFARVVLYVGEPIRVRPGGDRDYMETKRLELENSLNGLCLEADRHFDRDSP